MARLITAFVVVLMVGGAGWAVLAANAGQFKTLEPVLAGRCAGVTGAAGAEDLTIDRLH